MRSKKHDIIWPTLEEDAVIMAAALSDPDAFPPTEEELAQFRPWRTRFLAPPGSPTVTLSMEFDRDTIEAFKRQGDDWQQGINAVLREWAVKRGYVADTLGDAYRLAHAGDPSKPD
ncbi:hypothetical protein D0T25_16755 [Duganella sp. BJB488]|uniref:BrnA antitoxin family protein n=1 Tax=unclassified Duganella TaxID=2636909 RepID=UPI000E350543|nr:MULTISPECIES: BrnA antitoxin family protein [unclassified Duganella]RFP16916.1 hypothetical protein D0T26_18775 [Duganella sp. BJB489]RFP20664.1 hypothetical protein D0T25_16755 [Duganella sp. BJB488]RFP32282.1 hypothetical protein D0T24_22150 [Duganella sp. BJB480]